MKNQDDVKAVSIVYLFTAFYSLACPSSYMGAMAPAYIKFLFFYNFYKKILHSLSTYLFWSPNYAFSKVRASMPRLIIN